MRKTILIAAFIAVLALVATVTVYAAGNGAIHGSAYDPNAMWLGEVEYLFNKPGYHFWFTPTAPGGPYLAGHSYHNVYKYDLKDPSEWCGPVNIPDRPPYNAGGTAGSTAYYKIFDTTMDVQVCPAP